MGFFIMLYTVHTTQGQGQGQVTIVFYCTHPGPGPCPVPGPSRTVWMSHYQQQQISLVERALDYTSAVILSSALSAGGNFIFLLEFFFL